MMRSLILAVLVAAVVTAPLSAQTYDPRYPICKRVNSDAGSVDCYYSTMEQCKEDARGESAECVVNPFFKTAQEAAAPAPAPARPAHH
jgi:hypothetical protein